MLEVIVKSLIIVLFSLFPILLWGYGVTFLSLHNWNRARFFFGMIAGALSIGLIWIFHRFLSGTIVLQTLAIMGVFFVLVPIVWSVTRIGSPYIRGFLRQILLLHIILFSLSLIVFGFMSQMSLGSLYPFFLLSSVSTFVLAAFLEEGVKHFSTIGLTAKEFRFSRRDFLLFTFFVTLGFLSFENILYMLRSWDDGVGGIIWTGILRALLSSMIHIFAASICVVMWWKALSYKLFSWRYSIIMILGYVIATLVHALANTLLSGGHIVLLILLVCSGYVFFTSALLGEEE